MATIPKISIITPSVRPEGLKLVEKALKRQTFQEYEWILASPASVVELDRTLDHANYVYVNEPNRQEGDYWTIYKAYNRLVKRSQGELIVSWQDYTYTKPDTLEKFWFHHQNEPKTIISGVGNKYADETWTVMTWKDPREREDQGTFYQCFFNDIELNLASFPKQAFYEVGGFDEHLDKYSSLCGLDVLDRLNMIGGFDFKLDQTIKSYSLEHGRLPEWDEYTPFNGAYDERRKLYLANPKLNYLS